ncbi:MAG TPA: RdgB/HAM1 family non-canonical purine NTP pyrophosphatase [Acidobacteriota bacterium]
MIATTNQGKFREIAAELKPLAISLDSLSSFKGAPESPETGISFAENAMQKADFYFDYLRTAVLAEDSGLVIPSLDGFPGLHSARVAATDSERIQTVLDRLRNREDRSAYYVCHIVVKTGTRLCVSEGTCHGRITSVPEGDQGFGYDPIFQPEGAVSTFGQMRLIEKSAYSHRGRAARKLLPCLQQAIADEE